MKNVLLPVFLILSLFLTSPFALRGQAYGDGEKIKLRIHYGWFNASYASLEVEETNVGDTSAYHVTGKGQSTGLLHAFFKVKDKYQSWIDKETDLPIIFHRDINEGGHKKNKVITFNQDKNEAEVKDLRADTKETYTTEAEVQDMISVFYTMRNQMTDRFKKEGDSIVVNMFFDEENYKFKTVYLGRETIKTKFGKVKALKLQPYVQSGRVFEKKKGLTVWVSDDKNKIPLKVKAKLAVGSLTASIDGYENLKHSFNQD